MADTVAVDAVHRVGVVGAGTMGSGIAQVAAEAGFDVLLYDVAEEVLSRALIRIAGFINRAAEKGKIGREEAQARIARIQTTTTLADFSRCDFVIEAAPESLDLKKTVFDALDAATRPRVILATNTSTLSVTQIAAAIQRPERVVGMHFFNPAPLLPLVEVVAGAATAEPVVGATVEMARRLGKQPVIAQDVPGFIVNRVARPFHLEALRLLEEGAADPETIDRLVREGSGFKMGPFELQDLIGVDINYIASQTVYEAYFHEPRYRPSLRQQRMVESGRLGRKTGRGWFSYDETQR